MQPYPLHGVFQVGPWHIYPRRNQIVQGRRTVRLEPRVMDLLVYLAEHPGETVRREQIIDALWADAVVTDEVLTKAVSSLRKALGDDYRQPRYIETIPKAGYRLIAPIQTRATAPTNGLMASVPAGSARPARTSNTWIMGIALLTLLSVSLIWYQLQQKATPERSTPLRTVTATSLEGAEFDVALSPDGDRMAFVWEQGADRYDIYVKSLDTGALTQVTSDSNDDFGPAWSPDGHYLAFTRFSENGCAIMTIPASGGTPQRLAGCGHNWAADLAWSPDGKFLAYSDRTAPNAPLHIVLVSVETLERRFLTTPSDPMSDLDPVFSPDGRLIAFKRSRTMMMEDLYVAAVETGDLHRLTFLSRRIEGFDWAPDGQSLVFSPLQGDDFDLWRIALDDSRPERIATISTGMTKPSLARHAARMAYEKWTFDTNIWRLPLALGTDATPERWIASTRHDGSPQISPDGRYLAFASDRSGSYAVWIHAAEESDPVQLTTMPAVYVTRPRWMPDSDHLVFEAYVDGNADLYLTDVHGSLPRRLTTDPAIDGYPAWSPDGRWIYFSSDRTGNWEVWKMRAQGGAARRVTDGGGLAPQVAADGASLFYVRPGREGLWRVPLPNGQPVQVLPMPGLASWTVAGHRIYYVARTGQRGAKLHVYDLTTGTETRLGTMEGMVPHRQAFTVSPDEQWLYFTQIDHIESDLILVDGFQ